MAAIVTPPVDWLGACRRATDGLKAVLGDHPTTAERVIETGKIGGGGDRTLVIDHLAEQHVFDQLERFYDDGHRFTVVSEERGVIDYGAPLPLIVIDPLDGSLNAKRGLPYHALSVAVADGPSMADVFFAYVYDFGSSEEWRAERGCGAFLDDVPLSPPTERHSRDGRFELLALESTDPRWIARRAEEIAAQTSRLRAWGVMAISLCQLADTRVDGVVSLARTRSVDVAAGQLIIRESGGSVEFVGTDGGPLAAPLQVMEPRHPIVCARSEQSLARLRNLPVPLEELPLP